VDRVTVAICTWNRAPLLDQTLTQLRQLRIPAGVEWELLVVNNNCTDETDAVIQRHEPHLPIRRLFEEKPGLSHARNCAVEAAQGELILWTDDDVLVDPGWLCAYVDAANQWPDATFFGGAVEPWFASEPPQWIAANLDLIGGAFALTDHGPETRPLDPGVTPYGANMGMRLADLGRSPFDPRLGRKGANMLSEEETSLFRRWSGAGRIGLWVGGARVRHYIPSDRLEKPYLARFFQGLGRTSAIIHEIEGRRRILGVPIWLYRKFLMVQAKCLILDPFKSRSWVSAFKRACVVRGTILELLAARARP
jgi:glycosyltransferase involved in cell wall biosynthesis